MAKRIASVNARRERFREREAQREAIKWFIGTLRGTQQNNVGSGDLDPNLLLQNRRSTVNLIPGQIYFMRYDPKHKDTLPYYDTAPLFILLDIRDDMLFGINTHYLPYRLRIQLINALLDTITASKWDHKTKAKINYQMVKSMSKYGICKPALKSYLFNHMRSKLVRIPAENWKKVAYLPIETFVKASKNRVWRDSERATKRS